MLKLVVFDFDGTLADTTSVILHTWGKTVGQMGLPAVDPDRIRKTIGLPLRDSFRLAVPDNRLDEAVRIYQGIFASVAQSMVKAFDGIPQMLERISSQGIRMAVASSRGTDSLVSLVSQLGLEGYFEIVAGGEFATRPKPDPELTLNILERMGVSPEDTLVVGDAIYDLGMGKAAGCRTCGVTWGNQSREMLQTASPDYIADTISNLSEVIESL